MKSHSCPSSPPFQLVFSSENEQIFSFLPYIYWNWHVIVSNDEKLWSCPYPHPSPGLYHNHDDNGNILRTYVSELKELVMCTWLQKCTLPWMGKVLCLCLSWSYLHLSSLSCKESSLALSVQWSTISFYILLLLPGIFKVSLGKTDGCFWKISYHRYLSLGFLLFLKAFRLNGCTESIFCDQYGLPSYTNWGIGCVSSYSC